MKRNENELQKYLLIISKNYNRQYKVMDIIDDYILKKNMMPGLFRSVMNGNTQIDFLTPMQLGIFCMALYKATKEDRINPEVYYHDIEIKQFENYIASNSIAYDKLIIPNVLKLNDNVYSCSKISYKEINDWCNNGLLTYNFNTQRETYLDTVHGEVIQRITIYKESVTDMTRLMSNHEFFSNLITLNIRKTENKDKIVYNEARQTLTITVDEESFVDIVDGMHRILAIERVIENNADFEDYMMLRITNLDEISAWKLIKQENEGHKISEERIKANNPYNSGTVIAKYLNSYGTSQTNEMFGKIGQNIKEVNKLNLYTTIEILSSTIERNFDLKTARDIDNAKEYLLKFFNETLGILKEKYEDLNNSNYVYLDANIFIGYIAIANLLNKDTEWKLKLETVLNNINFDKDLTEWNELNLQNKNKLKAGIIDRISEYFQTTSKNILEGGENNGSKGENKKIS